MSTIWESQGPSSGKSVWKGTAGSSLLVFPPLSLISFRKYTGSHITGNGGDQLGLNIQWTILASKQPRLPCSSTKYTTLNFSSSTSLSGWRDWDLEQKFCGFRICSRSFFRARSISRGSWSSRPRIGRNPHSWLFLAPPIPIWVSVGPVTSLILANCPSGRLGAFWEQFSALHPADHLPSPPMPSLNLLIHSTTSMNSLCQNWAGPLFYISIIQSL